MRVLQAYKVYRPEVDGGIPEVMSQLAGLTEYGDTVDILVARQRGWSRRFVADGANVHAVASLGEALSMPIAPAFPHALRAAAARHDVLALHAPFPLNDIGLSLGVPDHVAVVLHWHAEILGRGLIMPLIRPFIERTLARADRIVVSDPSIITESELLGRHADKCAVIPYGIDVAYWASLDTAQRQLIAALRTEYPNLIVAAGRLVPYKGYPVLLKAMQEVQGHLVIIGEGREQQRLEALARTLGVSDRVRFKGFLTRDAMKAHLHAARAFVLPSVSTAEAFGIVQIEAMACGLPVVNTRLPTAVPNIARHNREGFTVTPGDAGELAHALDTLLQDPTRSAAMGAAARSRCEAEFSRSTFLSRIREVYSAAWQARRSG